MCHINRMDKVQTLIDQFKRRTPPRTGSLLVTLFGDCITPRGGQVWLGSLINIVAPLGLSHRLVRTAAYRLVNDGVLTNTQVGRRSFYSLTDAGQKQFADATTRIYAGDASESDGWRGQFQIVLTHQVQDRDAVRRDLQNLGFGTLGQDCFAHPHPELTRAFVTNLKGAIAMEASLESKVDPDLKDLVQKTWPLTDLADSYRSFSDQFQQFQSTSDYTDEEAFYLRTFLIHEYRRVLLRDPGLPSALLARDWPGHRARDLTETIYRNVLESSERYIDAHFECEAGRLPQTSPEFARRFL